MGTTITPTLQILDLPAPYIALGFPGAEPGLGIAGGAPGTNAVLESRDEWVVIVLSNFDPPVAERLGIAIANALAR